MSLWATRGWLDGIDSFDYVVEAETKNDVIQDVISKYPTRNISDIWVMQLDTPQRYVLAKNIEQYKKWMKENNLKNYVYFYSTTEYLKGTKYALVITLDGYKEHPSYDPEILYFRGAVLIDSNDFLAERPFRQISWDEVEKFNRIR